MALSTEVYKIVCLIRALHPEDPGVYEHWNGLTELLSADAAATIEFLSSLNDEEMILGVSSVFDEVSQNLQSTAFVACLDSLARKFPHLPLQSMVDAARNSLGSD